MFGRLVTFGIALLSFPMLYSIHHGLFVMFIIIMPLMGINLAAFYSVSTVILTELIPITIRCTALAIIYSLTGTIATIIMNKGGMYLTEHVHIFASSLMLSIPSALMIINAKIVKKYWQTSVNEYQLNQQQEILNVSWQRG